MYSSIIRKSLLLLSFSFLILTNKFVFASGPTSLPVSVVVYMDLPADTNTFNQFVSIYSQSVSVINPGPVSYIVQMPFDLYVDGVVLAEIGSGPTTSGPATE